MPARISPAAMIRHRRAVEAGDAFYPDPETGLLVMTATTLANRGECCGSGCRHCPYSLEDQQRAGRPDS